MKSKKCTIQFFLSTFLEYFLFFFPCSLCKTFERCFRINSDMYSVSLIKKFLVDTISPPEETTTKLLITHPNHESTNYKSLESTIEYDDMPTFHGWYDLAFYTIEEICWLHEQTCFRKDTLIKFFESFIGGKEISKNWSSFPWTHCNFMSLLFEHFFECPHLGSFSRPISTFKYYESSWKRMAVTDIWSHRVLSFSI